MDTSVADRQRDKETDRVGWLEFAGLENDGPSKNGGGVEFAGLENDRVEQEQMYLLHPMKNFNVSDMYN